MTADKVRNDTADKVRNDTDGVDEKVLALRAKGRSFGRIAEAVGLDRASEANRAFNRALRRHPAEEQAKIRTEENGRLDRLADAVRANESLSSEDADRRLHVIDRLRARLMSD